MFLGPVNKLIHIGIFDFQYILLWSLNYNVFYKECYIPSLEKILGYQNMTRTHERSKYGWPSDADQLGL